MLFVGICKGENKIIIIKKDLLRYGINIFKIFFYFLISLRFIYKIVRIKNCKL